MTRYLPLFAALLLAMPAAAQDQPAAAPATDPLLPLGDPLLPSAIGSQTESEDFDLARKKVVDCEGEKFVFAWGVGARPTKVTLCSKKNATPDELVTMLDDAANKLEQTRTIAEDRREIIVQQIRAKIKEVQSKGSAAASAPAPVAAPPAAVAEAPAAVRAVTQPQVALATLQPLPPPPARALLPKPRLSFQCYTPGEVSSGGNCTTLSRDSRLTVKAGEALPAGIGLRFRRNGETRAEVPLNAMRQGQSVRVTIPGGVCRGVVEAESEIEVVRSGQVVDSLGPYLLRC